MQKTGSVFKVITFIILPLILLYGLYIQVHGEESPGGGFQAGIILAAGVILYCLLADYTSILHILSLERLQKFSAIGILIYGGTGVFCILRGGNFLEYSLLISNNYILGQKIGVFLVELGVGITVFSVMLIIFLTLSLLIKND